MAGNKLYDGAIVIVAVVGLVVGVKNLIDIKDDVNEQLTQNLRTLKENITFDDETLSQNNTNTEIAEVIVHQSHIEHFPDIHLEEIKKRISEHYKNIHINKINSTFDNKKASTCFDFTVELSVSKAKGESCATWVLQKHTNYIAVNYYFTNPVLSDLKRKTIFRSRKKDVTKTVLDIEELLHNFNDEFNKYAEDRIVRLGDYSGRYDFYNHHIDRTIYHRETSLPKFDHIKTGITYYDGYLNITFHKNEENKLSTNPKTPSQRSDITLFINNTDIIDMINNQIELSTNSCWQENTQFRGDQFFNEKYTPLFNIHKVDAYEEICINYFKLDPSMTRLSYEMDINRQFEIDLSLTESSKITVDCLDSNPRKILVIKENLTPIKIETNIIFSQDRATMNAESGIPANVASIDTTPIEMYFSEASDILKKCEPVLGKYPHPFINNFNKQVGSKYISHDSALIPSKKHSFKYISNDINLIIGNISRKLSITDHEGSNFIFKPTTSSLN